MVKFVARRTFLLRMPLLRNEHILPTLLDVDPEDPDFDEQLTSFTRAALANPVFREAVVVSGGPLLNTVERLESGRPVTRAKLRRAALALARHLLRAAGRPTPFGLFAGVAVAEFGDTAKAVLGDAHHRRVQPDLGWLTDLVRRWELVPAVLSRTRLMSNNLCFVRGDRLVLPHVRDVRDAQELSVQHTAPVRAVLGLTRRPVPYEELLHALRRAVPDAPPGAFERLVQQLVEREILLTDLRPPSTSPLPLGHVVDHLEGTGLDDLPRLTKIVTALDDYAGQPLGHGLEAWRAADAAMRAEQPASRPPIHVDLRVDADVRLPGEVAAEAERAAGVLWRLSSPEARAPHLRDYHRAFCERYGSVRVVPVSELVDPETGLGYPAGYRVPRGAHADDPTAPQRASDRERVLSALVQETLMAGREEVVLDDTTVDRLSSGNTSAPPPDLDLALELRAKSLDAVVAGEFLLVRAPSAAPVAGALSGRFVHLFDQHPHFAGLPERHDGGPARLQLGFQPVTSRHANVAQVPAVLPGTVAVGTFAESTLHLDDIGVVATADRLHLVSLRDGAEFEVIAPHVLSLRNSTPNLARLLREISASGWLMCQDWSWEHLSSLPYLPRVRYGRTVLALARWLPPEELRDRTLSWRSWCAELDRWREKWRVPSSVRMADEDHRITLDLSAPLHRMVLRDELGKRAGVVLTEAPDGAGWLDGRSSEIVVSLTAQGERRSPLRVLTRAQEAPRRHRPGGEWISAKLYAGVERHDELLSTGLPTLLRRLPAGTVDRWFFVRYRDPRPHLRLRFHGNAAALAAEVLPLVHHWAADLCERRLASDLVLDSYEPEWARYGGASAQRAAERVFQADAEVVIEQLRLIRDDALAVPPDLLAAAGQIALLRGFGDEDWRDRLLSMVPEDHRRTAVRGRRGEALDVLEHTSDQHRLHDLAGPRLATAWRCRDTALREYGDLVREQEAAGELPTSVEALLASLMHLHCNRFIGMDREREAQVLVIARSAAQAHPRSDAPRSRVCKEQQSDQTVTVP